MRKENKKNFTKAMAFCIVFIFLLSLLNFTYYQMILTETNLETTYNQFQENKNDIKILFLGDSHTVYDINPSFINNSFNFGSVSENYIQTYYKLKNILDDQNLDIDAIVFGIDLHSFAYKYSNSLMDGWYWSRYIKVDEIYNASENITIFDAIGWKIRSLFPVIGGGKQLISFLYLNLELGPKRIEIIKGHQIHLGNFSNTANQTNMTSERARFHLENLNVLDQKLFFYFKKILRLAKMKELQVVLIKFPITEEYFNSSKKYIPNIGGYYNKITNETKNYNNIHVLDYQRKFFGNNSLFSDPDHTNRRGAELLSKQINEDLQKLNISNWHFSK